MYKRQVFKQTEFGSIVHNAIALFNKGKYEEARQPWEEALRRDSNYWLAYIGLGNAYLNEGDYDTAMKYFYYNSKSGYNDAFKSWLFQITANECKKLLKQKSIYLSDASWQEPAAAEDGYLTPEIQDELSQLSEPERRVITLSVFGGYTSREIAGILKKREGSIRSIKSRALAKLREKNAGL